MNLNENYAPILGLLAGGEHDTIEIMEATGIPYSALVSRLMRLRDAIVIEGRGRRRKLRAMGAGYVMVWALASPKRVEQPEGDFRIAGTITHGRGSKWGAGRA